VLETFQLTINRASGATETVGSAQSGGGGPDPMAFDPGPHKAVISEMLNARKARAIEHSAFRPARAAADRGHLIRRRQTRV